MDSVTTCPFCQLSVLSSELERHANGHFEDDQLTSDAKLAQRLALLEADDDFDIKPQWGIDGKISCLVSSQMKGTFYKFEGDPLISLLKYRLQAEHQSSISLLSGYVDHFQTVQSEDGGWGCGWRNIQMLCSHLIFQCPDAKKAIFGGFGFVPDIGSLQRWLEIAWEKGFDVQGSEQFGKKIYGLREWIGATECAALLRYFGVRARIVDFSPKKLHPFFQMVPGMEKGRGFKGMRIKFQGPMDRFVSRRYRDNAEVGSSSGDSMGNKLQKKSEGYQVLIDWIWNYFSDGKPLTCNGQSDVISTEKPPLYFQHDGHSRTIIGIQVQYQRNGAPQYNLLVLDPAHRTADLEKSLKRNSGWQQLLKRGVHTLKKPQYQLCYIDPGIASRVEMEELKKIDGAFFEI